MTADDGSPRPRRSRPPLRRGGGWRRRITTLLWRRAERYTMPILGGPVFFAIARAAYRLNLIGILRQEPGLTFPQLKQRLKLEEQPLHVLLLGCVVLRLVRKRGERYYCGSVFARHLFDRGETFGVGPFLEWMQHIVAPSMRYLEESLREARAAGLDAFPGPGDTLYERMAHDPQLQAVFYAAMNARTRPINDWFVATVDFSAVRNVLDVGGGDGEVLAALAVRYPHLQGTVLELPAAARLAAERFRAQGLEHRLRAATADITRDDFPPGHDCVLFAHINGNHSPATNRDLLRRAFAALPAGGLVILYSAFMDDAATGPASSAMISAYFYCTVSGQGRQYSWRESEVWLREAGFASITRAVLVQNHGVILGRKPASGQDV
jgi:hypothetical protein